MSARTFKLVSVGGFDPEPARIKEVDDKRVAFTCGCPDPFFLDEPDCPCIIVGDFTPNVKKKKLKKSAKKLSPKHAWMR